MCHWLALLWLCDIYSDNKTSRECKKALRSKFMSSGKKKRSVIHGHLPSRYDQVPFWIFSLKMCSSPISTNDICSLCEVVRAFLHQRDEVVMLNLAPALTLTLLLTLPKTMYSMTTLILTVCRQRCHWSKCEICFVFVYEQYHQSQVLGWQRTHHLQDVTAPEWAVCGLQQRQEAGQTRGSAIHAGQPHSKSWTEGRKPHHFVGIIWTQCKSVTKLLNLWHDPFWSHLLLIKGTMVDGHQIVIDKYWIDV